MKPVIVAIAGGSGSGKTSLVRALVNVLGPQRCAVLELDAYYRDLSALDITERRKTNFDHPQAFDFELFSAHLKALLSGDSIEVPIYAFKTHQRVGSKTMAAAEILIVEGILALYDEGCRNLANLKIFIDIPHEVRLERRIRRDVQERGWSEDEVKTQYDLVVKPMYDLYVEPTKKCADTVFCLADQLAESYTPLIQEIEALIKGKPHV